MATVLSRLPPSAITTHRAGASAHERVQQRRRLALSKTLRMTDIKGVKFFSGVLELLLSPTAILIAFTSPKIRVK